MVRDQLLTVAVTVLRPMTVADVASVVAVQEPASVLALASVFPQETHPFPTAEVTRRWHEEVADPAIDCWVVEATGETRGGGGRDVAGFAAVRDAEFLHFGVAVPHWGSGLASQAHDEVLEQLRSQGVEQAWLRVFTGNGRARTFYERHGWSPTGETSRTSFPPHPELLRYERSL